TMFHGDRLGAVGTAEKALAAAAGLRCAAGTAPARDAGTPGCLAAAALRFDAAAANLALASAGFNPVAAPVDGTAARGAPAVALPFAAMSGLSLGAAALCLVVFRCASAKGITHTARSRIT